MLPGRRSLLVARLRWQALALALLLVAAGCARGGATTSGDDGGATPLRVSGSTTVNPVVAEAAAALRGRGVRITVDTQGGSAGGIAQLGAGQIDVAMSSKPISDEDRRRFPSVDFVATPIGEDAVGAVVRREVYDRGVRNLDREQLAALFEGRVRNWSELGGPDVPVFVYDKEPGRGTREVLDAFLYGRGGRAPASVPSANVAVVGGNEEARAKLLSTPGSVGPLSVPFITGYPQLAAVAVDGVEPTPDNVKRRSYPLSRPLLLVTDGAPTGPAKRLVDHLLSPEGQALLARHGFLSLADLR
jgi:phosphate transport system substrate-binding protein